MAMTSTEKEVVAQLPPFFYYYSDGSIVRSYPLPPVPASHTGPADADPDTSHGVASKDITLNSELGLWARIFVPPVQHHLSQSSLPVVLYFHGGGFLFGSPNWPNFHAFCEDMASRSNSIWISASYRLAPEHRLPTPYDDGFAALDWLKSQALQASMDTWLAMADFSKCFIAGESAGGNIAHHVAMRAIDQDPSSWKPLCISGVIHIHPGFVRGNRTQEELDAPQDHLANWEVADACFKLSVPPGTGLENPYWNPLPEIYSRKKHLPFPKALVALADHDMLYIMGKEYVKALRAAGCHVDTEVSHGVGHVFFIAQPESEQAKSLMQKITEFITKEC